MGSILRDTLKMFLPGGSLGVYMIACRFGFSEEAKAALRVSNTWSIVCTSFDEETRHTSSADLL